MATNRAGSNLGTDGSSGFTLVEMAFVLVVLALAVGGLLVPLQTQFELQRTQNTRNQLADIKETLIGFALANDRLPCPATPASAGRELPNGGGICAEEHGFIPAVNLGLSGTFNDDNLLLDAWGNPIRYSVTDANAAAFTTAGEMQAAGIANLDPDLVVCNTSTNSIATGCDPAPPPGENREVVTDAPAVFFSTGPDPSIASPDQAENAGATLGGGPTGINYNVPDDIVFVMRNEVGTAGQEFDDLVEWLSPNVLYARMVAAGRLP